MIEKSMHYLLIVILAFFMIGCSQNKKREVVVYTSVDQVYSSKIFALFEKETGIKVRPLYDAEAAKAVGLKRRLIAERDHPRADVFWNSEQLQTLVLAQKGVFAPYHPKNLDALYPVHKCYDKDKHLWYGIGGRLRVIVINPKTIQNIPYPKSLMDLWDKRFAKKVVLSYPFAGTAATHMAALYARMGAKGFQKLIDKIKQNHTVFVAGNSVVMEDVASGRYLVGLTDTDDVLSGRRRQKDVKAICYDQAGRGNFLIHGTVSLVRGGPNPQNAKKFIDFLLSPEVEEELAKMGAIDVTLLSTRYPGSCKYWSISPYKLVEAYQEAKDSFVQMLQ